MEGEACQKWGSNWSLNASSPLIQPIAEKLSERSEVWHGNLKLE